MHFKQYIMSLFYTIPVSLSCKCRLKENPSCGLYHLNFLEQLVANFVCCFGAEQWVYQNE